MVLFSPFGNIGFRKIAVNAYYKKFRNLIHWKITLYLSTVQLNGIIEIDETLIYKRKYVDRGREYRI